MKHTRCSMKCVDLFTAIAFLLAVSWSAAFAQSQEESPSSNSEKGAVVEADSGESPSPHRAGLQIDRSEFTYDGQPFEHWHKLLITELKPEKRLPALRAVIAFGTNGYADEVTRDLIRVLNGYDESDEEELGPLTEGFEEGDIYMENPELLGVVSLYSSLIQAAAEQQPDGDPTVKIPTINAMMPGMEAYSQRMSESRILITAITACMKISKRCSESVLVKVANEKSDTGLGRLLAINLLGETGTRSEDAVSTLLAIAGSSDEKETTRNAAICALAELHPPSNLLEKSLEPFAKSPNPKLRRWGIAAYGAFGESAREAAPILLAALSDSDPQVVVNAARSLSMTDQLPRSEAPKLLRLLSGRDETICNDAATQLGELGLFRAYRRGDLKEFGVTEAELHDPHLAGGYIRVAKRIEDNTNYSADVALSVIQILGTMGTDAIDAAEPLRKIAANEAQKSEVRKAAEEALVKITGVSAPVEQKQ